jgi:hypothetical protein
MAHLFAAAKSNLIFSEKKSFNQMFSSLEAFEISPPRINKKGLVILETGTRNKMTLIIL